jgi:hypothetical protein
MKNVLYVGTGLLLLMLLADKSHCQDIMNLRDQSTLRCPGGIVARGDSERVVQRRCGDPLKIADRQDSGPIWIYHFRGGRFMYYLTFLHGNLQRIGSATCNPNRPECLDIR